MLIRKLLYSGTSKLIQASSPAIQRCFSDTRVPLMTLRCVSMSIMSRQNSQNKSRSSSSLQNEMRRTQSTHSHLLDAVGEDLLEEEKEEVTNLASRFMHTGGMAHQVDYHLMFFICLLQVLVLLPYVKLGAEKKLETNSSLMLAEAEALVRTLEWKVLLKIIILYSIHVCAPLWMFLNSFSYDWSWL